MRDAAGTLATVGATPFAVGFSPAPALAALADHLEWPHPFLADPGRLLYARLGFRRASRRAVYNAGTLRMYADAALHGRRIQAPVEDTRQLGGDAVVQGGRAVRIFTPASPDDRTPVPELAAAVLAAAS